MNFALIPGMILLTRLVWFAVLLSQQNNKLFKYCIIQSSLRNQTLVYQNLKVQTDFVSKARPTPD